MKKALLLSFFLFLFSGAFAQDAASDKASQDILKGVSAKYKSFKSLKAFFTINIENPKDKSNDVQKGTLYLKGNKYRLEIAGQDVISDGKTRWTFVKDANEVQIDNQKNDENSINPTSIFTIYEKGWLTKYTGEQKDKNTVYQLIEMVPVDSKKKNIFKVKLNIHKQDKYISTARIFNKNGTTQTISVDKLLPDGAADESNFNFRASKYPGAEIIDLR